MAEKYANFVDGVDFINIIEKERLLPNTTVNVFKVDEFGIPELFEI